MTDRTKALADKAILVIGGAGGIGSPVSRYLASAGARVAVADTTEERAARVVDEIVGAGGTAVPLAGDISVPGVAEALVSAVVARFGRLDGLVNLATFNKVGDLMDYPVGVFDRIVAVNLRGAMLIARAAARQMAGQHEGGSIVLFSSVTSLFGAPGQAVYGMTKAGLLGLVKSMALEWARLGVRVNGLSPTTTDTPLAKEWLDADPDRRATIAKSVPVGRLAVPEDCFGVLELLLGNKSRFLTGQTIYVDGGVSVTHPLIKG
jgi:NAD(P)-dependent dehydrogenase (short-subunit alcohol dehydrogenase family)